MALKITLHCTYGGGTMSVVRHFATSTTLNTYKSTYWMDANRQLVKQNLTFAYAAFFVLICIKMVSRPADNYKKRDA